MLGTEPEAEKGDANPNVKYYKRFVPKKILSQKLLVEQNPDKVVSPVVDKKFVSVPLLKEEEDLLKSQRKPPIHETRSAASLDPNFVIGVDPQTQDYEFNALIMATKTMS